MSSSNKQWDIIPDIHGHAFKLTSMLSKLGYVHAKGVWRHPDPNRTVIFLGDFIDRGPDNGAVIDIVRRMIDAGSAQAIMGNHELNAIHFHTLGSNGVPLRERCPKNVDQHEAFLKEFPVGESATNEAIKWMQTLPLFLELEEFRVVHASWSNSAKKVMDQHTSNGCLSPDDIINAANSSHPLFDAVETLAKGPEQELKDGCYFHDKGGHRRTSVRVKWWQDQAKSLRDIAISVPDVNELSDDPLPKGIGFEPYQPNEIPVFFGHYWLTGEPVLQSSNTLCLDYSVGKGGPLTSYTYRSGDEGLDLERVTQC